MAPGNWIVYSQLFENWNDCGLTHSCPHLALGLCKHPVLFPEQLQDTNVKCFPGNSQPSFSAPKAQSNLTKCRRIQVHTHPRPSSPGTLTRRLSASSDNSNFAPSENTSSGCFSARYKGFPTEVQWEENTVGNTGGFLRYSQVLPVGLVTRVLRRLLQPGCTFWIFPVPVEDAQAGKEVWDVPRGPLLVVVEACPYSRTCYGALWPYYLVQSGCACCKDAMGHIYPTEMAGREATLELWPSESTGPLGHGCPVWGLPTRAPAVWCETALLQIHLHHHTKPICYCTPQAWDPFLAVTDCPFNLSLLRNWFFHVCTLQINSFNWSFLIL